MGSANDLPDFIIGGAPRSGTTLLCHVLDHHPDIFVAKPYIPEPKVFMGAKKSREQYLSHYRSLFSDCGDARYLGEKTSYYLESQTACDLIRQIVPQAKLIFIVREPVARAYSNYLWTRRNGLESLSFEQAIALEGARANPLPPDKSYARPYDYLVRGDYATFAERFLSAFGKERVAFFLYEDIQLRPAELFMNVQRFIGVDPVALEAQSLAMVNSARELGPTIDPDTEKNLRARMAPLVTRFAHLTGLDLEPWGYPR